ncbi:hypothetical protein [Pseudovibrio sp. Tun.PSC04-5.I4]|uniref:hypothetical protein n=1 Tax=Pseudovibrio sp. Tun.PSC04-5.I4 TaxID=1798213 RepID=UPI00088292FB|nr:hypothetical protein [Pseudovibrio sp. Tun.PSC04-5.I4]SDQ99464.1 hypothetical protein SAMN04515695_2223 [Pseudovibrio sp. Tun.PSC04-5.I4]
MAHSITSTPAYFERVKQEQAQRNAVRVIDLVSLLEWTYGDQKAHQDHINHDEARYLKTRSAMAVLEQLLDLGKFVDGGGRSCVDLHPDAATVHGVVLEFAEQSEDCAYAAGLLIYYASHFDRPEKPVLDGKRLEAKRDRSGRVAMSYWCDGEELFEQPGTKLAKPHDYDGPGCRVGQACELTVRRYQSDLEAFLHETFNFWCASLEIIADVLPLLKTHKLKPYQSPTFDRAVVGFNYLKRTA